MGWHVLRTYAAQEQTLARYLDSKGIIVIPTEIKITKPRTVIIQPFLPRYVLACVDLDDGDKKALVKHARGLHSILEFSGKPAVLPVLEIDSIIARIKNGYIVSNEEDSDTGFRHGDRVGIIRQDSMYFGWSALFDKRLKGKDRVRLMLEGAGLFSSAEVSLNDIELIERANSSGRN